VNVALARLALRRALPPGAALAGLAAAALTARAAWQPDAPAQIALGANLDAAALCRAGAWSALLVLYGAWLSAAAAALPARWRSGEAQWLARGVASSASRALSLWLGLAAAATTLLAVTAAAGEIAAHGRVQRPARELAARFEAPRAALAPGAAPLRVALDAAEARAGDLLRVELSFLGGGPVARVSASWEGGGARTEALLSSAGTLELALDPGVGPRVLALEHLEGEALLSVSAGGIQIVRPLASGAAPARRVAARALLVLAAWTALAMGLGAWMAPGLAWGLVASAALALFAADASWTRALPGARLLESLERLGQGIAGPWPSPLEVAAAAAVTAAGVGLAGAGLRRWRSTAR
jgi:hypothetical protein